MIEIKAETIEQKALRFLDASEGEIGDFKTYCDVVGMAIDEEREACKEICEGYSREAYALRKPEEEHAAYECANLIRARGE